MIHLLMRTANLRMMRSGTATAVTASFRQFVATARCRLATTLLLLITSFFAGAQGPTFTSTAPTTATMGQSYSYEVSANNYQTLTAPTKPSWLTLSSYLPTTSTRLGTETIYNPNGIASDGAGNVYVAQETGGSIYKIAPDGSTTLWFTRKGGLVYGLLVLNDYLYIAYNSPNGHSANITKINLSGAPTETTVVSGSALTGPTGMVYKDGFLYIADNGVGKVRKLNLTDNTLTDVLTLNDVWGLDFAPSGLLYVIDAYTNKVYSVDVTHTNPQSTLTEKYINVFPYDVKVDANGNVYISGSGFVRRYTPDFSAYTDVWAGISNVYKMSHVPGGALVFGLYNQNQVRKLQPGNVLSGTPGIGDVGVHAVTLNASNGTASTQQNFNITVSGPATFTVSDLTKNLGEAPFTLTPPTSNSSGAFTYTSSNTSVATISGNTVTLVGAGTTTITVTQAAAGLYQQTAKTFTLTVNQSKPVFNSTPVTTATVGQPYIYGAMATDAANKPITLTAVTKPSWLTFSSDGQSTSTQFGAAITSPTGIANDAAGNIYVAQYPGTTIYKITPDGTTTAWFTRKGGQVYALVAHDGFLYVSYHIPSGHTGKITKINLVGNPIETELVGDGTIDRPVSMVQKDGFLYIASWGANKVVKLNLSTNAVTDVLTLSGACGLGLAPSGLLYVTNQAGKKVYSADLSNANPTSTLTEKATLPSAATDVKVDVNGNVYVSGGGFVRKYTPDFSSHTDVWTSSGYVWGMSLTPGGALVFGLYSQNQVHKLQTGAVLSGTPSINDIGVHPVVLNASNGTASTQQNFSITVSGPATFTVSDLTKNMGDAPFTLTPPTSNSSGAFTYTSSNTSVATISGNTVTLVGAGTTTITVTQAAAGLYQQTAKTFTLTVNQSKPVFNSTPVTTATVGQPYIYGAMATDAAQNPITLTAVTKPSWLTFSSNGQATSTQFGTTIAGPSGVAADDAGNVYVTAESGTTIYKIAPDGTTTSWATRKLGSVYAMLMHDGYLYVSYFSPGGHTDKLTRINLSGTPVETTLVSGSALNLPVSMVHKDGFLYVADYGADKLRKVKLSDNSVTDVVDVRNPFGLGFAPSGLLYVASFYEQKVYSYDLSHATPKSTEQLKATLPSAAIDVKVDANGNVYVSGYGFVRKFSPDFSSHTDVWSGSSYVWGMSLTPGGALVFGLYSQNQVHKLQTGAVLSGTPSINDIGVHPVVLQATNGTASTQQEFDITVYGPATFSVSDTTKYVHDGQFTLINPSSNSSGAFTYTSSNTSVATISGNTVTLVGAGTTTITVTQAAAGLYLETAKTFTLTVLNAKPTITAVTPASALPGATITISGTWFGSTTAVSINDVAVSSFTVVNDTTLTAVVAAGNTTGKVKITNAGGSAVSADNFTVLQVPAISGFSNLNKTYGDAAFTLTAPASTSNGAFTYSSSNTAVATISGNTVTIVGAGTATITATQAATATHTSGTATATLTVAKATPVLSGFSNINKTYGDAAFTLTAPTSNSNGAFTYSSSNTAVATVSGNAITIVGAGTATITATQAATANYNSTTQSATLTVAKAGAQISNFTIAAKTFGDAPFTLVAPQSLNSEAFSYSSSNTAVATVSGNTVTIVGAGTATITASQPAGSNYQGGNISATLVVNKAAATIGTIAAINKTYGDGAFAIAAPTSNGSGAFTYTSSNTAVATIDGNTVTIVGAGTTTITATQAADANHLGGSVQTTLTVGKAAPVLGSFNNINKTYGDAAFDLSAPSSTSNGNITFSSSNASVATIDGNTVTIVGAGTAVITATQAATANYNGANITATLTVAKATPVLNGFANLDKTYGEEAFTIQAPASVSNGAFTYSSSNTAVATVNGNTITIVGAGTATITATQAATDNYSSAATTATLTVEKAVPVLSAFDDMGKTYGDAAFTIAAPSSASNGAFTYTSSNTAVASINGNSVTIVGAGTATITAIQAESANYKGASVTATITVAKAAPSIGVFASVNKTYGDAAFALTAPASNSTGAFTYSSSNTAVAKINGNTVTIVGAGTATITATQAGDANYLQGSVTTTLTVAKATPALSGFSLAAKTYGDAAFNIAAPASNSNGAFTYSSSNASVATISGNRITIRGAGTATITATQAATANYTEATITATLTVAPKMLTVTVADKIRCVGYQNPQLTYAISGFIRGENASVLQSAPLLSTTANEASAAGTYAITATGAQAANYSFTYVNGTLTVANPEHTAQRIPVVDALKDEPTRLQARSFGVKYQWSPQTGLSNTNTSSPVVRLQNEQEYQVAITEASGCVVVDTVLVRVFEQPDVFVPTLFSPNGDGINDVLRLNAVSLRSLTVFRIYNQWGKLVFTTSNLNEGWDGTFQGQVQPMATYTWVLSGTDKNGKPITRSGSVTLAR